MVEVKLYYKPWWLFGRGRQVLGRFPERFEELSERQLVALAGVRKGVISEERFLAVMSGIRVRLIKRLDLFQQFKVAELLETFREPKAFHDFQLKKIWCKDQVLLAPKTKLKGVTFGQFIFADTYFSNYNDTKDKEDLYRFVASVYLPAGMVFNEKLIDTGVELVRRMAPETVEAVYLNYLHVREWLALAYPLIFIKPTQLPEGGIKEKKDSMGWIKIFEGLVGDDIVNEDRYADLPMHNVFRYMTGRIKENMKKK